MPISPMYQSQAGEPWLPTLTIDSGTGVNLTGVNIASFVLTITNIENGVIATGGGVFAYVNQSIGSLSYSWGNNDTAIVGRYTLQISYTDTNGKLVFADPILWVVRARGSLIDPP